MIKLTLTETVEAIGGRSRDGVPVAAIGGVSTDSRSLRPGELFFAIPGPHFDGHDFVPAAAKAGAVAAVIASGRGSAVTEALRKAAAPDIVLIEVDDVVRALGRLAAYHRQLVSATLIAVVGSNGKTTTKSMITHVLAGRMSGRCSPKSFNNAIGVPLTLLSAEAADEFIVVEIGTSAPGEVAALATLARPDMAVLTCLAEEHLEGLGSLGGVAAEECSVFDQLSPGGFAAVNVDNALVRQYLPTQGLTLATFGWTAEADIRLTAAQYESPWLRFTVNGRFDYRLRLAGKHNAVNACGAITVARRMGLDHAEIAGRLETFALPPMRNEVITMGGITLLNDAYNANPGSALAALDVLESLPAPGRRLVVFGEMCELGDQSAELHRRLARQLAGRRVDRVCLVGAAGAMMAEELKDAQLSGPRVVHCADVDACLSHLREELRDGDVLLLKASRAVGLDRLVEPLRQHFGPAPSK
ncbi:MAG: UDP-N-acetylmuramoyl-tripeptide--D-alanyl-D-alanine ligase [Phycisphaerae bacterium]